MIDPAPRKKTVKLWYRCYRCGHTPRRPQPGELIVYADHLVAGGSDPDVFMLCQGCIRGSGLAEAGDAR